MIGAKDIAVMDELVCRALDMRIESLCWLKYEYGCAFLEHWIGDDRQGIAAMERLAEYWAWWKQAWMVRDKQYLSRYHVPVTYRGGALPWAAQMQAEYRAFHSPRDLAARPNSVVMAGYHRMIKELSNAH